MNQNGGLDFNEKEEISFLTLPEISERINGSPKFQELYFENQVLRKKLTEIICDANNTRKKLLIFLEEYQFFGKYLIAVSMWEKEKKGELKIVSRVKAKKQLYSTMENCGICLEDHKYTDVCTLPCNHEYGTKCFENWYTKGSKTCPECRNPTKEIKTYRCVPIDTAKSRRDMEMVDNIIESSPILLQLYGEIKLLRRNLNEKIINANNTQKRLINILTEIDVLTASPDFA